MSEKRVLCYYRDQANNAYFVGWKGDSLQCFHPSPTTALAAAWLWLLAAERGRRLDVTSMWADRDSQDPQRSIRRALQRVAADVSVTNRELGVVLAQVRTSALSDGRVEAYIPARGNGLVIDT
jgi:hypothetical protein